MGCLDQISKNDSKYRQFARQLCGCDSLADDLVNEMYLRVHKYEQVNDFFVFITIRNLFYNYAKQSKKRVPVDNLSYIPCYSRKFEPDDQQQKFLKRFRENTTWVQRELIAESFDRSLRQIEATYKLINYAYAHRELTKARKAILGEKFPDKYENSRRKN